MIGVAGKAKVKELVEVISLYPRQKVDNQRVIDMIEALKAGVKLPPVIVEEKTMRIVDGVHRTRAYKQFFDGDYEADVIFRAYESDQELFLDAVSLNAVHGKPLQNTDKTRVIFMASRLKIPKDQICTALAITIERMDELKTERAKEFTTTSLSGKKVSKPPRGGIDEPREGGSVARAWENVPTPSIDAKLIAETSVQQLINFLRSGTIKRENLWLIGKMKELYSLLGKFLEIPKDTKK